MDEYKEKLSHSTTRESGTLGDVHAYRHFILSHVLD